MFWRENQQKHQQCNGGMLFKNFVFPIEQNISLLIWILPLKTEKFDGKSSKICSENQQNINNNGARQVESSKYIFYVISK